MATKGKRLLTCQDINGADVSVPVRQIRIREYDQFAALLATKDGDRRIGPGEQANGFVKLFTGLDQAVIDEFDHESVNAIVQAGLEMNAGFFDSYPASLKKGLAGIQDRLKAVPSPSTNGSTPASTQPDAESKSAAT